MKIQIHLYSSVKMDSFQLPDFSFEFDFQSDFTEGENCVIDELLANPIESTDLFDTSTAYQTNPASSSSFFDYLCNNSNTIANEISLGNLSTSQLVPYDSGFSQVQYEIDSFANNSSGMVSGAADTATENMNFDWTKFLDESSADGNSIEAPLQSQPEQIEGHVDDSSGMICDNGCVYQELKTLDIPQMYSDLDQTFDLTGLKERSQCIDYSVLAKENEPNRIVQNNENHSSLTNSKVFLLPFQMNAASTQSLYQMATKLKDNPMMLDSMIRQCANKNQNPKILIPSRPKQVKPKTKRYLTVDEQLKEINTKKIVLPSIGRKLQRQSRKQKPQIDKEKVEVKYSVQIVLEDVMEDGTFGYINNDTSINDNNNQPAPKKSPKSKKLSPNSKPAKHQAMQTRSESKSNRRTSKKLKTP